MEQLNRQVTELSLEYAVQSYANLLFLHLKLSICFTFREFVLSPIIIFFPFNSTL